MAGPNEGRARCGWVFSRASFHRGVAPPLVLGPVLRVLPGAQVQAQGGGGSHSSRGKALPRLRYFAEPRQALDSLAKGSRVGPVSAARQTERSRANRPREREKNKGKDMTRRIPLWPPLPSGQTRAQKERGRVLPSNPQEGVGPADKLGCGLGVPAKCRSPGPSPPPRLHANFPGRERAPTSM